MKKLVFCAFFFGGGGGFWKRKSSKSSSWQVKCSAVLYYTCFSGSNSCLPYIRLGWSPTYQSQTKRSRWVTKSWTQCSVKGLASAHFFSVLPRCCKKVRPLWSANMPWLRSQRSITPMQRRQTNEAYQATRPGNLVLHTQVRPILGRNQNTWCYPKHLLTGEGPILWT